MKRSKNIRLLLLGGVSAALSGAAADAAAISASNVYTNNYYVPGVGYYHAPARAFFPLPYNHFDTNTQRYFHAGAWLEQPARSITNISSPFPEVAAQAQATRTDISRPPNPPPNNWNGRSSLPTIIHSSGSGGYIPRNGFGSSSSSHFTTS